MLYKRRNVSNYLQCSKYVFSSLKRDKGLPGTTLKTEIAVPSNAQTARLVVTQCTSQTSCPEWIRGRLCRHRYEADRRESLENGRAADPFIRDEEVQIAVLVTSRKNQQATTSPIRADIRPPKAQRRSLRQLIIGYLRGNTSGKHDVRMGHNRART